MSDHKAVLREHIKLLDAVVNNPEVQIKSYEKVIENLSYTARMPDNELRQKRLQALHLQRRACTPFLQAIKSVRIVKIAIL